MGKRKSLTEQGVERLWQRRNVVFRQKFISGDSPVGKGVVVVQDPVAGEPLLRAMSAHSVAETLCYVLLNFILFIAELHMRPYLRRFYYKTRYYIVLYKKTPWP